MPNTNAVYFGGSRHPQNINPALVAQVVGAVVANGQAVHVGCQYGADQAVIYSCSNFKSLSVFAVAPSAFYAPAWVCWSTSLGASVTYSAGGNTSIPINARYLLRSIRAFQGCNQAIFFSPGAGSLAVARECVRSGLSVFAFQQEPPARVPSVSGQWFPSSLFGFQCWQWSAPKQISLF